MGCKMKEGGKKWASNIESNMPSMDMMDGVGSELEAKGNSALGKRYKHTKKYKSRM